MKPFSALFFLLLVFIIGGDTTAHSSAGAVIYFYNPETNINNFATLKTGFDTYLSTQGPYQFQPFDSAENFEEALKQKKGNLYLLSSWHLAALRQRKIPLEIVLVATSKGNTMQSKILSAKREITDVTMLKDSTIAGSANEGYIRSVLSQMFGAKNKALLDQIKILVVPKDADALLSVSFGVSAAAVSTESSLNKFSIINPKQFQQLHTLGVSEKSYFLIAATLEKPNQDEMQLIEILHKMAETEAGEKNLNLLGLDGWKAL
ncbi:MAG: hypothetical protein RL637_601 [Pseudomonadota bacterium]|jgi:hypothetical protein